MMVSTCFTWPIETWTQPIPSTWIYPNSTQIAAIALKKDKNIKVEIDFANTEARLEILPPSADNMMGIAAFDDKAVYLRRPNTDSDDKENTLYFFDLKEREEKKLSIT